MIVRILSEGQYKVPSAQLDRLNDLDNKIVHAVSMGDGKEFEHLFTRMIKMVRDHGEPLAAEVLSESEVILPAPDTTLEEAKSLFVGGGLIPD